MHQRAACPAGFAARALCTDTATEAPRDAQVRSATGCRGLAMLLLLVCAALTGCSDMANQPPVTASVPVAPTARADAAVALANADAAPVFDVPRVENLKIDGDLADWGTAGLRIESLVEVDKLAPKPSDFDAKLYLAWNDQGLVLAARVHDRFPQESDNDSFLYSGDGMQIYVADAVNGPQHYQLVIAPGMDPKHPAPRRMLNDGRRDGKTLGPLSPEYKTAKTPDGYNVEVLLPWAALGVTPKVGGDAALQVFVANSDPGSNGTLVWYPSVGTGGDWTKMQHLRLSAQPSPPVCASAMVEEREMLERTARVTAVAEWTSRTVQVWQNGRLAAEAPLQPLNDRAQAELTIPLPKPGGPDGPVVVKVAGDVLASMQFQDLDGRRKRAFVAQDIAFRPGAFSGEKFPACDFTDPALVRRLVGPYELNTTFYNARSEEVTKAAEPGRYGAIVEIVTRSGKPLKRYRTLYRMPGGVNWQSEAFQLEVAFPQGAGIAPEAEARHAAPTADLLREWLGKDLRDDSRAPVLLAGLHELKAEGKPVNAAEDCWALDRQWWVSMKRHLNGNAERFAEPLVCPRPIEGKAARVLRQGSLDEAGFTESGVANLDRVLKTWEADSHEAFAVGVSRHGVIAFHKAYGTRDDKPMTVDTPSAMASITKIMSGTLVMTLVDQKKVDLDAPVETYLPALRGVPSNRPLRVWNCFTHTNGLWSMEGDNSSDWEETVAWMLPDVPVSRWPAYGSPGPSTGGKIIEAVSGEALPQFYQHHLLGPLGMTRTTVTGTFGDARSVPLDMLRFGQMLANRGAYGDKRFFAPETLDQMLPRDWKDQLDMGPGRSWVWGIGCRWMDGLDKQSIPEGVKAFGHEAASSAVFIVDLTNDMVITMTRNTEGKDYGKYRVEFVKAVYEALAKPE